MDYDENHEETGVGGVTYFGDEATGSYMSGEGADATYTYLIGGIPTARQFPRLKEGTLTAIMMQKQGSLTAEMMGTGIEMLQAVGDPSKAEAGNTAMLGGAMCVVGIIALVSLAGNNHRRRKGRGYTALPK